MEFSFVGIQGRRERVIGSNRTVGGSSRETKRCFPIGGEQPKPFCGFQILSLRQWRFHDLEAMPGTFKSGTRDHRYRRSLMAAI